MKTDTTLHASTWSPWKRQRSCSSRLGPQRDNNGNVTYTDLAEDIFLSRGHKLLQLTTNRPASPLERLPLNLPPSIINDLLACHQGRATPPSDLHRPGKEWLEELVGGKRFGSL